MKSTKPSTVSLSSSSGNTLADFNSGSLDDQEACRLLDVRKTRLYQLRTLWLKDQPGFRIEASGSDQCDSWPESVLKSLCEFVPLQTPPN